MSGAAVEGGAPRWIEGLLADRLPEVEDALRRADEETLARIADEANALRLDRRPADPQAFEIAGVPLRDEILPAASAGAGRARVEEAVAEGRVAFQFLFAGAATRMGELAEGLYFLDLWTLGQKVAGLTYEDAPAAVRKKIDRAEFEEVRERVRRILAEHPPAGRLPLSLGPRQVIQHRSCIEALVPGATARARMVVHVPATELGGRIIADFRARHFFGFDPRNVFFLRQPYLAGWTIESRRPAPLPESIRYPFGHGHATLQMVERGAGERGDGTRIRDAVLDTILKSSADGPVLIAARRVNDLTVGTTGAALDASRFAAAFALIEQGSAVAVELVSNPKGQKGGQWVRHRADGRKLLVEKLSAKTEAWKRFLEAHPNSPYNAFRNMYDGHALRRMLCEHELPPYLRVRPRAKDGSLGLYFELVSGDVTAFPEARAEAFRNDADEPIHDFKEFRDLVDALPFAARQDEDPAVRRIWNALEGGRR
ncbi:MAG: hypothetical protein JXP34_09910 [Planctomycetes bacterium]|nr:hypothetical protein [Planctomycetota bacterium]